MAAESSTATRRVAAASPDGDVERGAPHPPLHVVPSRRAKRAGGRIIRFLPVAMVVVALLVVVVGQALLANGQVRMSGLEQRLQAAQAIHRQQELNVTKLETPSRIVAAATGGLHMVHPSHVTQLPYVSLNTPLPTPAVTPASTTRVTTTPLTVAQ